jgi:hypothetical protein
VTVCNVDNEHITAGLNESGSAVQVVILDTDSSPDQQTALGVQRAMRTSAQIHDVTGGDQTTKVVLSID